MYSSPFRRCAIHKSSNAAEVPYVAARLCYFVEQYAIERLDPSHDVSNGRVDGCEVLRWVRGGPRAFKQVRCQSVLSFGSGAVVGLWRTLAIARVARSCCSECICTCAMHHTKA
jgi:hypothetical protein